MSERRLVKFVETKKESESESLTFQRKERDCGNKEIEISID